MAVAILDTNVLVQAAISPRGASFKALSAHLDGQYQLVFSTETLNELEQVLLLRPIQARHGWSEAEVEDFVTMLAVDATIYEAQLVVPPHVTRDITDTKFLSLAAESTADFLVTNDRRHLLRLRRFGTTRIITPAQLLAELP